MRILYEVIGAVAVAFALGIGFYRLQGVFLRGLSTRPFTNDPCEEECEIKPDAKKAPSKRTK